MPLQCRGGTGAGEPNKKMDSLLKRSLNSAILFALGTMEVLSCYKSLLLLYFIPLVGLVDPEARKKLLLNKNLNCLCSLGSHLIKEKNLPLSQFSFEKQLFQ